MLREQIYNLPVRLRAAANMPATRIVARVARRLPGLDNRFFRLLDLRGDPRLDQHQRMREWLARYEAFASDATGWQPLDFAGARVLEIGPGPLGGWGPLALFRGAAGYLGVEPRWDPAVFFHPLVRDRYLAGVHRDLAAHDGDGPEFEEYLARFGERFAVFAGGIEIVEAAVPFDIVLSNSCLEHIGDFAAAIRRLAELSHRRTRFLHLVNFSNHRNRAHPFAGMYAMPPDLYRERYGRHVNLLRPSDMQTAFEAAGIRARCVPMDVRPDAIGAAGIDSWWAERYDRDELAVRTALFLSEA